MKIQVLIMELTLMIVFNCDKKKATVTIKKATVTIKNFVWVRINAWFY